ncbi:32907_t:CDS:1, partial [Racocetra persica]
NLAHQFIPTGCYELCCKKHCLKEELKKAGNRIINESLCEIKKRQM